MYYWLHWMTHNLKVKSYPKLGTEFFNNAAMASVCVLATRHLLFRFKASEIYTKIHHRRVCVWVSLGILISAMAPK